MTSLEIDIHTVTICVYEVQISLARYIVIESFC